MQNSKDMHMKISARVTSKIDRHAANSEKAFWFSACDWLNHRS